MAQDRRLGTGRTSVWLYARGGQRKIAPLPHVSVVKYGRRLSEVSVASVTSPTGGHGDCCSILGQVASWGHEVVIFRDDRRVWEGPITQPVWGARAVTLTARDVMVKTSRSAVEATFTVDSGGDYVVNQAYDDLLRSFGVDDPNVLAHVQVLDPSTGPLTTREVTAGDGYWLDQFSEHVKAGLQWTVVGRRIVLWPVTTVAGRTASTLLPMQHLTADVEVTEDGMALSTDTLGANDAGETGTSPGVGLDPFYGRVQQVMSSSAVGVDALASAATQHQAARYPAPLNLRVPEGAVLSCDAPFDFSELVPGVLVPVELKRALCRDVSATQQITAVDVTVDSKGEQIALSLSQPSGAAA